MTIAPIYDDPKWLRYMEATGSVVGYFLSRGGIMVIGGLLMWGGYITGLDFGREDGFLDGCRAIAAPAACDRAQDLGRQLHAVRATIPPRKQDSGQIDQLCTLMREEVSPGVAIHYGCPGAAP